MRFAAADAEVRYDTNVPGTAVVWVADLAETLSESDAYVGGSKQDFVRLSFLK